MRRRRAVFLLRTILIVSMDVSFVLNTGLMFFAYVYSISIFITGILMFTLAKDVSCYSIELIHIYTILMMVSVALGMAGHFFSKTLDSDLDRANGGEHGGGNVSSGFVGALCLVNLIIGTAIMANPGDCVGTRWFLYLQVTWLVQVSFIGCFFVLGFFFFVYYFVEDQRDQRELIPLPIFGMASQPLPVVASNGNGIINSGSHWNGVTSVI